METNVWFYQQFGQLSNLFTVAKLPYELCGQSQTFGNDDYFAESTEI